MDIGRLGNMPDGQFLLSVNNDVISVPPEVGYFFSWSREGNHNPKTCIIITFADTIFIKSILYVSLKVVFLYSRDDGTGIDGEVVTWNDFECDELMNQIDADFLKVFRGGIP